MICVSIVVSSPDEWPSSPWSSKKQHDVRMGAEVWSQPYGKCEGRAAVNERIVELH